MIYFIIRNVFFILFLFATCNLNAQPSPGNIILNGSSAMTGQFFSNNYKSSSGLSSQDKTTQFNFQPSIGVYVTYHINLGISLGYNYQNTWKDNTYNKLTIISLGPYARFHFTESKFAPFLQTNIGYSGYWVKQKENSYSNKIDRGQ
jgi:hypothetical protein